MDIYENLIKQSSVVAFIVNPDDGVIVDTNAFTIGLLDTYDISGRSLFSLLDDMSQLNAKLCFMYGDSNPVELNLLTAEGDTRRVTVTCSRINGYMALLGVVKESKPYTLRKHLEEINTQSGFGTAATAGGISAMSEQERRAWQLSNIDQLTGLYNRTLFVNIYKDWYDNAFADNKRPGVIILDIDNFKGFNDNYGHEKGDRVLVGMSHIILSCIRNTDYAIRYDGDEFIILLYNISSSSIINISERIRQSTEAQLGICLSLGCVTFESLDLIDSNRFIEEARKALQISKGKGNNIILSRI